MEKSYRNQVERIDRLIKILEADNLFESAGGLLPIDVVIFACQSMWHLKDWILNDPSFGAKDNEKLKEEIHASRCLLICSDIANGSKHLSLVRSKTGGRIFDHTGTHLDPSKGIFRELFYVVCADSQDEFHGMEVREFLRCCREQWQTLINQQYLSEADDWIMNTT